MAQTFRKEEAGDSVRLNKYISDSGICSRREADRLIAAGKVLVDGRQAEAGQQIRAGQRVTVEGREISREEEMILLAVNKPRGVVCTTDKRWGDETIYDVLRYPKRIFSVGRLDKESEGLLLMTNNGEILNKIMRAGNYHEKEYLVTVDREITPEFLEKMGKGVYLRELDVTTRPCRVELAGKNRFRIVLTQGLNRQIRRMCAAFHYNVTRLVRVRIMNIELGNLKPGEYRSVSRREYARLQEALKDSTNPGQDRPGKTEDIGRNGKAGKTDEMGRNGKTRKTEGMGQNGKTGKADEMGRSGKAGKSRESRSKAERNRKRQ